MKTNAIMKVRFGDNLLTIGHKDKMGNLNELVSIGNQYRAREGFNPVRMDKILELKSIKEYIIMLENKEKSKYPKLGDLEVSDIKEVRNVLKTKRGKQGGTWAQLNLMIRVAIEINPVFADEVITTFINGKILEYRDVVGDDFKMLNKAVNIFEPNTKQRIILAKGLNYIVFGKHNSGLRDNANSKQLSELKGLQEKLSFVVDMGYIRTFDELINEMRRIYHKNQN